MESLEAIDRSLFLFLNGLHASWLDMPMWYISGIKLWAPLFLFFIYYAYKHGQVREVIWLIAGCSGCIAMADISSVHLFKEIFQRVRPTHNTEIMDLVHTVVKPNGEEYRGGYLVSYPHMPLIFSRWLLLFTCCLEVVQSVGRSYLYGLL